MKCSVPRYRANTTLFKFYRHRRTSGPSNSASMITPASRGSHQYYQQSQYLVQSNSNQRPGSAMMSGMQPTSSYGQIYYRGGGQWRIQHSRGQYSNMEPRRSSYGDLSSSGSGNFQGDCGGGFRYSSNEDLFYSQVQVAGGVTTPSGSSLFLFCPPKKKVEETFDLRAATEQLIDRTQQLQAPVRPSSQAMFNRSHHSSPRSKYGEWAI